MRRLHLRLCAPLGAFGGEAIDAYGVTRDFPARSMLAGLLANALGWRRAMREQHQALQDRLVFGAVQQRAPTRLTDYQTARLHQDDCSWSTRGAPIGRLPSPSYREGGPRGRQLTHQQWRDYLADLDTSLVERVVSDIDEIVRHVRHEGWPATPGGRAGSEAGAQTLFEMPPAPFHSSRNARPRLSTMGLSR